MSHGGMTYEQAEAYVEQLIKDGRCTCMTKTNDPMWHAAHCVYRLFVIATRGTVVDAKSY